MKSFEVKVRVRLKDGILDPETQAIESALKRLDFKNLKSLKRERSFCLEIEAENEAQAKEVAREMANQLLANLVMEDFEIE